MSKIAVISYHKNLNKIYPQKWVDEYRNSILTQTYKLFDIHECDYGGGNNQIFETKNYSNTIFETFVDCMNHMITDCFNKGYDYVFNTNCDDYYSIHRISAQLKYLQENYDIVSSNFALIDEDSKITHFHKFSKLNLRWEIARNHNIIAHPCVAYSKRFWMNNKYVPSEIPSEDLLLWKRAIPNHKMIILENNLLFHRIHNNSVCKSENR